VLIHLKLLIFLSKNIMLKLASIPSQKMSVIKRPTNFISFEPQQKWQTKMGKIIVLVSFFIVYMIFFALFLYFNIQWKSMEFKWKDEKKEICTATVSMIDFLGDINSALYCIVLLITVGISSVFCLKKDAISSHIYITLTIFATVTSVMSFASVTIYAFGNGWNIENCTDSKIVNVKN
jgi:hypothetical protein